jgi:hypothetical protein
VIITLGDEYYLYIYKYMYIYIYISLCVYIYVCLYIYRLPLFITEGDGPGVHQLEPMVQPIDPANHLPTAPPVRLAACPT